MQVVPLLFLALAVVSAHPHERQLAQGVLYTIVVRTGDLATAGTHAHVTIVITGDRSHTDVLKLQDRDGGGVPFTHSATDTFHIFAPYVGHVTSITIAHDNLHDNPSWLVDWVKVTVNEEPPVTYVFLANRWLATNMADHQTHATLTPA